MVREIHKKKEELENLSELFLSVVDELKLNWKLEDLLFEKRRIIAWVEGSEILGFIVFDEFEEIDILVFGVRRDVRGKGIGKEILREVLKSGKAVFAEVEISNFPSIKVFRSLGFEEIGIRKNFFGFGRDAIVFKFVPHKNKNV